MAGISINSAVGKGQAVAHVKNAYSFRMPGKSSLTDNSFQSTMDLCKKSEDTLTSRVSDADVKAMENGQQHAQKGSARERVKSGEMNKLKKKNTLTQEQLDSAKEAEEMIVSKIAQELDVSEEDIKIAMETLGMNVFELGNANQMSALLTEILGISDSMQIVTDGDLFASLTSLTQAVDDIIQSMQRELQIPMEEVLEQLERQKQSQGIVFAGNQSSGINVGSDEPVETVVDHALEGETEKLANVSDDRRFDTTETVENSNSANTALSQEDDSSEFLQKHSDAGEGRQSYSQNPFVVATEVEQTMLAEETDTRGTSYSMVNDILNQIGEYVKTNVTVDVKQMEIQLTPANLGRVHINLVSQNGVITAQITAENETVKNAIELQVVQLKERLEEQGVRIEAVEVTVASHEFERNLDKHNEKRETKEEVKRTSSKKWNLSELDGELAEGEALSDAEQVELDMMKLKGNQLNYMV